MLFSKFDYLILMQYEKHALRIYFKKLWKIGDFTPLYKALEPHKLL